MRHASHFPHFPHVLSLPFMAGVVVCVGSAAYASGYNGHYKPAPIIGGGEGNVKSQDIEPVENLGQKVPPGLAFIDGHGKTVRVGDVLGKGSQCS